jgi:hypothetical protein
MISEHEFQQIGEKSSVELMFAMMAYKTQLQNSLKEILTQSEINSIKFSVIDQGVIDKLVSLAKPIYAQNRDNQTLYSLSMSIGTILKEFEWGTDFVSSKRLYELAKRIFNDKTLVDAKKMLSFGLKDRDSYKRLIINVSIKDGMVVTSKFTPNSFSKLIDTNDLGITSTTVHLSALDEFVSDCQFFVNILNDNALDWRKENSILMALIHVINDHIRRCNRIFFIDLISYVNVYCFIMHGVGFSEDQIKNSYLKLVYNIVKKWENKIMYGNPTIGVVPFSSTKMYKNLENYVIFYGY